MSGQVQTLLIMFIVMSAVVIGISGFYGGMVQSYSNLNETNLTGIAVMNETMDIMGDMNATIADSDPEISDIWVIFTTGAFNALKIIPESLNVGAALLNDFSRILGLPEWVFSMAMIIISIICIFAILKAIFKVNL